MDLLRKFGQRTVIDDKEQREDMKMHMVNVITMELESKQKAELGNEIPEMHKERLRIMVEEEYKDVITMELGHTDQVVHKIELVAEMPSKIKRYQIPQAYKMEVEKQIKDLLETGKVRKSDSQFASPLVIVKKKDQSVRLCCDYRELNKITKIDAQPMRDTKDIIEELGNAKIFSHCDLNRGFWQVGMEESSVQYTAFATDTQLLAWNVMPFGLINSSATCTRLLAKVCEGLKNTVYFVDDMCVYSNTWEEHIMALRALLDKLREFGLTVSPKKLKVAVHELEFLGFKISKGKIFPTERNKEKILNIKTPTKVKEVKSILGLCNFYKIFINHYSQIVEPLRRLLIKNRQKQFVWTDECESALSKLKEEFSSDKILRNPDFNREFILFTDASNVALGASLMQEHQGSLFPVCFLSRTLSVAERNYSVIERECLAIVWAITKLNKYLLGRKFTLMTDHKPLLAINKKRISNGKIQRWSLSLLDYQFDIKSISGRENVMADFLSRQIIGQNVQIEDKESDRMEQYLEM